MRDVKGLAVRRYVWFMPSLSQGAAMKKLAYANERGQTMAEYGVVLALVTLAVLAALTMLGGNVSNALSSVANLLP
jgi:Flp pilus assembly pilin Flp